MSERLGAKMATKVRDLNEIRSDLKHYSRMLAVAMWDLEKTEDFYLSQVLRQKCNWYRREIAELELEFESAKILADQ